MKIKAPLAPPRQRRVLRLRQVKEKTGLGHDSIYRLGRLGKFPKRIKLSENAVGWLEDEIDAYLDRLAAQRDAESAAAATTAA